MPKDGALIFCGLLILLVFAPLPFGAILPWAQAILTFAVFALLAMWVVSKPPPNSFRKPAEPAERNLTIILTLWGLGAAFAFLQIVPLPPSVIAALSPTLYDLYGWTLPGYGQDGAWRPLSTTPGSTIQSGLLIGACGSAFFLVVRQCRSRARLLALAITIILVGVGEAIYGLVQVGGNLSQPAAGTFINRNHFAALLGMALCLSVGLLLSRWQTGARDLQRVSRLDRWARTSPLVIACLIILAGLIFSFSRMGLMAPVLMLVLFGGGWMFGPVSRRTRLVVAMIGAISLLLVAGAWPALEVVAERFQTLEEAYRKAAWEGTYRLFQSSPAVGIGLGGLGDNLPRFLPTSIPETFDHSHNEPLEVLAEGGLVYAVLLGTALLTYWVTVIPAWLRRRDPLARGLGVGCTAGVAAVAAQSFVEFPLRMPANALYLSVIMGIGWAIIHKRTEVA